MVLIRVCLWVLAFTISSQTLAESLKICTPDFEPWAFERNGVVQGIMMDQAAAILKELKIEAVGEITNYARMFQRLRAGECELGLLSRYEQNLKDVEFIETLYDLQVVVIAPKNVPVKTYEDLLNKKLIPTIGFPLGGDFFFPKLFDDPHVTKEMVPTQHHGVQMLNKGRLGAFVGVDKTILYELKQHDLEGKMNFPGYRAGKLSIWLQVSKKSARAMALIPKLKKSALELKKNGTLDSIINKWIDHPIKD